MNFNEMEIYNEIKKGASIKGLAKKYSCSRTKIQNIKDNGRYYLNMTTGEIIFTAKQISVVEWAFHYLDANLDTMNSINKSDFLRTRATVPRLASYLMSYFQIDRESKESFTKTLRNWRAKELKLVGCNEEGAIDEKIIELIFDFYMNEQERASKSYYLDERGLPRGYGLWYFTLKEGWLRYLEPYIKELLANRNLKEQNLIELFFKRFNKEKEKIKDSKDEELKKAINDKLKYNDINSMVAFTIVNKYKDCRNYKEIHEQIIKNNRILYTRFGLKAYYQEILLDDFKKIVEKYL